MNTQEKMDAYEYFRTFIRQCTVHNENIDVLMLQLMTELSYIASLLIQTPTDVDGLRFQAAKTIKMLGVAIHNIDPELKIISLPAKKNSENLNSLISGHKLMKSAGDLMTLFLKSTISYRDSVLHIGNLKHNAPFRNNISYISTNLWELSGLDDFSDLLDLSIFMFYHPSLIYERNDALRNQPFVLYQTRSIGQPTVSLNHHSEIWTILRDDPHIKWLEFENCTPNELVTRIVKTIKSLCELEGENNQQPIREFADMLGLPFAPEILEDPKTLLGPILLHTNTKTFMQHWNTLYGTHGQGLSFISGEAHVQPANHGDGRDNRPGKTGPSPCNCTDPEGGI